MTPKAHQRARHLPMLIATAIAVGVTSTTTPVAAVSGYTIAPVNAVNVRSSATVVYNNLLGTISGRTPVDIRCDLLSTTMTAAGRGTSAVWDYIEGRGWVSDLFVDGTPYQTLDSRLPRCTSATNPTPVVTNAENAARWAEAHLGQTRAATGETNGNNFVYWSGWCEVFSGNAYRLGAALSITTYASAAAHAQAVQGHLQTGTPPRGALVFYTSTSANGHVAISVGNGYVIGTVGNYGQQFATAKTPLASAAQGYIGWYLP
jgi:hypothetical protein